MATVRPEDFTVYGYAGGLFLQCPAPSCEWELAINPADTTDDGAADSLGSLRQAAAAHCHEQHQEDGMIDRVIVYKDTAQQWRWRRQAAGNNEIIADSGEGHQRRITALIGATRANAGPYILEVDGEIEVEIDASGRVADTR